MQAPRSVRASRFVADDRRQAGLGARAKLATLTDVRRAATRNRRERRRPSSPSSRRRDPGRGAPARGRRRPPRATLTMTREGASPKSAPSARAGSRRWRASRSARRRPSPAPAPSRSTRRARRRARRRDTSCALASTLRARELEHELLQLRLGGEIDASAPRRRALPELAHEPLAPAERARAPRDRGRRGG